MEGYKVVGVKHGHKDGKNSTILYFEKDFEDYEKSSPDYTCSGVSVDSEYFRKDLQINIGDVVEVVYRKGFDGKAFADSVNVLKRGDAKK